MSYLRGSMFAWQLTRHCGCAGGRELIGNGYPGDVTVSGGRTDSTAVLVLTDGGFIDGACAFPPGGGAAREAG